MNKNTHFSELDHNQIVNRKFDESLDADRVTIVGGDFTIDSDKIAKAVGEAISGFIKINNSQPQIDKPAIIQTIEKNVFIPQIEIKTIEIPVIVKEIEYKTIEVPVITERIVTIEKPVIIKEIEFKEVYREKEVPTWHKVCIILQTIVVIGLLLSRFIK